MRLFLLTSFTMTAFASNSILTRMAIEPGWIDPVSFALIRVLSGAALLTALVLTSGDTLPLAGRKRLFGALSLAIYMVGFSLAYVSLDAGLGALILFGVVQITMLSYSAVVGDTPSVRQVAGAIIAFVGLLVALWPENGGQQGSLAGPGLMVLAGIGWAAYTLSGKNARNPVAETGANFVICFPVLLLVTGFFVETITWPGALLAVLSGAVTSGLGYALWYRVLPDLPRSAASVVQLSVPVIAILAGAMWLAEPLTLSVMVAAALVVLGIWMAVKKQSSPAGRN